MNDLLPHMERSPKLAGRDFYRLSRFVYEECGIKMPATKKTMLEARLQKRLRGLGMRSFADYCNYLFSPEGIECELIQMIDLVTTNKTDFFREADHFGYLLRNVLPEWMQRHQGGSGRKFMVWSAGCSTGEEPYTLAMVLNEFAAHYPGFDYQILATDISVTVLEKAQLAVYKEERTNPVPVHLKRKYLLRSKDRSSGLVRIVPELRGKVRFRRLNFMDSDFRLREQMDVIFCRNVMIYFDRLTQERLLNRICGQLCSGGHLFIGHSETLNSLNVSLKGVHPTIYRKLK